MCSANRLTILLTLGNDFTGLVASSLYEKFAKRLEMARIDIFEARAARGPVHLAR